MAIHTELEVYQLSRDLLHACTTLTRSMPRDYKATLGRRIFNECVNMLVLIQRANVERDKEIGRAHVELPSLMRISYAVFCLKKKTTKTTITHYDTQKKH